MFKFNFNPDNVDDSKEDGIQDGADLLPSKEIIPSGKSPELAWDGIELSDSVVVLKGRVSDTDASKALQQEDVLHSDLIPGKYEGGFKLWEGGIDLAQYLVNTVFLRTCSSSIKVLELGCGHGLPGIVAVLAGATVDFQDYNEEVLEMLTYPSVMANWQANRGKDSLAPPVKYFSGDWGTLGSLLSELNVGGSYDIILTTETIYTLEGMSRLFQCIKQCLKKPGGVCYVGAKSFYFGVGGGVAAFIEMVEKDGEMKTEVVSTLEDGLSNKREILALSYSVISGIQKVSDTRHDMPASAIRLGFIGCGRMGNFMASNLAKSGYKLFVCDKNPDALEDLEAKQGAQIVDTPSELGSIPGLRAVISMLPSPQHVKDAYLGPEGLFSTAPHSLQPSLLIDSSTTDPGTAREIAEAASSVLLHPDSANAFSTRSPQMIDAPVSGGVPGAAGATLTFMAGGQSSAVKQAEPILLHMGKRVVYCGKSGSGQAAKLANNLALAIQMASVAEALNFGVQQGLDPAVLSSIFNSSSAHCWSSEKYNPVPGLMDGVPSARGYQGGFSTALMLKDLKLALTAGEAYDVKLPMTKKACDLYEQLAEKMGPTLDFSAIYKYVYGSKN